MAAYKIGVQTFEGYDPGLELCLVDAYTSRTRPLCMCTSAGAEMYIARVGARYILKRMPFSGHQHSSECESYDPPAELSGVGQLLGSAIRENIEDGHTELRLDFSLSKKGKRVASESSGEAPKSVKTDGNKLSLRGLLHFLWEQAGFNRWSPAMEGKRNWQTIRKYLCEAADNKNAKNLPLAQVLMIPERFSLEKKDEIDARRRSWIIKATTSEHGAASGTPLLILIAELKDMEQKTRYGHKFVFKHLPDFAFAINEDLYRRFYKRYADEIFLWKADNSVHPIIIATFSLTHLMTPMIEEMALILVDSNFIPFESESEKSLIDKLVAEKRRFVKCLRYNLNQTTPMAVVVLSDTPDRSTAVYVVSPEKSPEYLAAQDQLIAGSSIDHCIWDLASEDPLLLPAAVVAGSAPGSVAASPAKIITPTTTNQLFENEQP